MNSSCNRWLFAIFLWLVFCFIPCENIFANPLSWPTWVAQLRQEAVAQGIRPQLFDDIFSNIHAPSRKVLHFDRTQPEKRIDFMRYRTTRADAYRIQLGRKEYQRNRLLLERVGRDFGVNACFIASLWGMETSYGRFMGNFPVIQSLATLAYDNRRAAYFRSQLLIALHILNDGQVALKDFKGEWAGASGQCQFLPSSWQQYAVDYDHDGRKDIWKSKADVFASIANYLAKNGWQANQPWAIEVSVPQNFNESLVGNRHSITEWRQLGLNAQDWPKNNLSAKLVHPDGGPYLLTFNNFDVLMRWNHSVYYVCTVAYLAQRICQ